MKIIQSYAKNDFESVYTLNVSNSSYLNFYSFLLSYITLKKLYGSVTMFTNKVAYDRLIRFIPYDQVVFFDGSEKSLKYWSHYKVDVMKSMNEDFIHVDSDVFLFNDLLSPFRNENVDGIVQDIFTSKRNTFMAGGFYGANKKKLYHLDITIPNADYGKAYSCGVIGMKRKFIENYAEISSTLKSSIDKSVLYCDRNYSACVVEEVAFYFTAIKNRMNIHSILPFEETSKNEFDFNNVGNKYGYTHLWFQNKFKKSNIELIKNKIERDYSEYLKYIHTYERYINDNKIIINYV